MNGQSRNERSMNGLDSGNSARGPIESSRIFRLPRRENVDNERQRNGNDHENHNQVAPSFGRVDSHLRLSLADRYPVPSLVLGNDIPNVDTGLFGLGRSRDARRRPEDPSVLIRGSAERMQGSPASMARRPLPAQVRGDGCPAAIRAIGPVVDDTWARLHESPR